MMHISVARLLLAVCCALCPWLTLSASTQTVDTEYQRLRLTTIADGLQHPWAVAFLPDGQWLVTERRGRLLRIDTDGSRHTIGGLPEVAAHNQGGLMDVVLHPDHTNNRWVYLTYSQARGDQTATTLLRGRLDSSALLEVEELFVQDRFSSPGRHYGSRLAWMPDGTLLMSVGDRGVAPPRAQDLADHAGKLLRLNDDGSVPQDNPFVGYEAVHPEIYSYGHRNIQGLLVIPESGTIWATEHGPRGGDELNRISAGGNYGWPLVSRGLDYRTQQPYFEYTRRTHPDMIDPVIDWTPSLAASGLARVPEDSRHYPMWRGDLLAGGLRARHVRRIHFIDDEPVHEEELVHSMIGRIRDVRIGPDGMIYLVTDEPNGALYRLEPAAFR